MKRVREATSFISSQVESSRLFFLDADELDDFTVVFGGYERCRLDYRMDREDFPWFCLEFVNSGRGVLQLGGVVHELRPGSIFLYGPGVKHQIESSAEHPLGKYFVGFHGCGVEVFFERYGIESGMVARCLKGETIRRTFDTLLERGVRKSGLARPLCALITRQLLLMCRDDAAELGDTDSRAFAVYERVRDLIEENFLSLATLAEVARQSGVEAAYVCRLFARYHDESPYRFLTRLRMEHASRRLLEGGQTIKAVSAELGFKDAFHFSRVFKGIHHVPPSRFRQSMPPQWPG